MQAAYFPAFSDIFVLILNIFFAGMFSALELPIVFTRY